MCVCVYVVLKYLLWLLAFALIIPFDRSSIKRAISFSRKQFHEMCLCAEQHSLRPYLISIPHHLLHFIRISFIFTYLQKMLLLKKAGQLLFFFHIHFCYSLSIFFLPYANIHLIYPISPQNNYVNIVHDQVHINL